MYQEVFYHAFPLPPSIISHPHSLSTVDAYEYFPHLMNNLCFFAFLPLNSLTILNFSCFMNLRNPPLGYHNIGILYVCTLIFVIVILALILMRF